MARNYEKLARVLELKYGINIKRFCNHLIKIEKPDFLIDFKQERYGFPQVQKEIDKANKIFSCDMNNILQDLCNKIKQDEYIQFTETLSRAYQSEKVMFLND